ncbi:MAG: aminotransferase class I/II-fold pyridoxal phosphate-dependent enzyme [Actinobacteria bacterium]|nr:MAG: aminotransferase class I/II-fold pyridoxal phosphate-dependent enzyme [Actinomycetota bacterium]
MKQERVGSPRKIAASRVNRFTESVIREMTRLADEHKAINLAQGFPDFDAPDELKEAAIRAIQAGVNQYPVTWGSPTLRGAIATKYGRFGWPDLDPETEIVVTCGSTEAMASTFLALVEPGQEVLLFEPFYENYGPDAYLSGAVPKVVPLGATGWDLDVDRLRDAVGPRTRAIVLNTPHNPTGKVFSPEELSAIAEVAIAQDLLVFTDEIYEHIVYDGRRHLSIALLPGMRERTVTISALSKTYSVTGWRVGWAIGSREVIGAIRKVHDFLTVAAPAPLQEAGVVALALPDEYYEELARSYQERRDVFLGLLATTEFGASPPEGAYYTLVDVGSLRSRRGLPNDTAFCEELVVRGGVAAVPGSSFFANPFDGQDIIRLAFPKRLETLRTAGERLAAFAG